MVVMDVFTRRIIGFGVAPANLDGPLVCRMFNRAIAKQRPPRYLSSDHDPLFRFHRWLANLRVLEVDEIKAIPCTPRSHAFVERLIGTVRREYLDRTLFWNQSDLERKLENYKTYYNQHRVSQRVGRSYAGSTQRRTSSSNRKSSVISLAATLQRLISDPNCRMNWYSPHTASSNRIGAATMRGSRRSRRNTIRTGCSSCTTASAPSSGAPTASRSCESPVCGEADFSAEISNSPHTGQRVASKPLVNQDCRAFNAGFSETLISAAYFCSGRFRLERSNFLLQHAQSGDIRSISLNRTDSTLSPLASLRDDLFVLMRRSYLAPFSGRVRASYTLSAVAFIRAVASRPSCLFVLPSPAFPPTRTPPPTFSPSPAQPT